MGFSPTFGARRFPKGNEGKRVSSGYNRRRRLATRSSGKQQAERTAVRTAPIVCPEESPLVRPQAHISCRGGLTRRLRRGRWGCRPEGVQYFLSKRKKVPKKASGTATLAARPAMRRGLRSAVAPSGLSSTSVRFAHPSGKKASIAHFAGGARNVARIKVASYFLRLCALLCSPFSAVKMGGPFSLRCLSPLGSPAGGAGQTQPMRIGMFWRGLGGFAAQNSRLGFCSTVGINNHAQTTQLGCFDAAWIFSQRKRPA